MALIGCTAGVFAVEVIASPVRSRQWKATKSVVTQLRPTWRRSPAPTMASKTSKVKGVALDGISCLCHAETSFHARGDRECDLAVVKIPMHCDLAVVKIPMHCRAQLPDIRSHSTSLKARRYITHYALRHGLRRPTPVILLRYSRGAVRDQPCHLRFGVLVNPPLVNIFNFTGKVLPSRGRLQLSSSTLSVKCCLHL